MGVQGFPNWAWTYGLLDRKSTRLNSSHSQISYAVFCLKKKNVPRNERGNAALIGIHPWSAYTNAVDYDGWSVYMGRRCHSLNRVCRRATRELHRFCSRT